MLSILKFHWLPKTLLILGLISFSVFRSESQVPGEGLQASWTSAFNEGTLNQDVLNHYLTVAGIDYGDGFSQGQFDVLSGLVNLKEKVGGFDQLSVIGTNRDKSGNILEIGQFTGKEKGSGRFSFVVGWRHRAGEYKKEVELIYSQAQVKNPDYTGIDLARELWEKHSNDRRPDLLVGEVYTADAIYFNNAKISRGKNGIIDRYAYMKGPQWTIDLQAVETLQTGPNQAVEIGTYKSNGEGQYLLIWKKGSDGRWRVAFDFNF